MKIFLSSAGNVRNDLLSTSVIDGLFWHCFRHCNELTCDTLQDFDMLIAACQKKWNSGVMTNLHRVEFKGQFRQDIVEIFNMGLQPRGF